MSKYQEHSTIHTLRAAEALFLKYPNLPSDWDLSSQFGEVEVKYVYINGEGLEEMKAISKALGENPRAAGGRAIIDTLVEVGEYEVNVRAQMSAEVVKTPPVSGRADLLVAEIVGA